MNWGWSRHSELRRCDFVLLAIIWTKKRSERRAEVVMAGCGCCVLASVHPEWVEWGLGQGLGGEGERLGRLAVVIMGAGSI